MPSLNILKYVFSFAFLVSLGLSINPTTVGIVEIPSGNYSSSNNFIRDNSLVATKQVDFRKEGKIAQQFRVIVTAYSSTPEQTDSDPFITAAGTTVRQGIIANNLLPFGTIVRLPEIYGERLFVVEDRMNWRKGSDHFDIWFPSSQEAREFGVKRNTQLEIIQAI